MTDSKTIDSLVIHNGPDQMQMVAIVKRLLDMRKASEAPTVDFETSDGPINATVYGVFTNDAETAYRLVLGIKNCPFAEAHYSALARKGVLQMA